MMQIPVTRTVFKRHIDQSKVFLLVWSAAMTVGFSTSAFGWYKKAEELGLTKQRQEMINETVKSRYYW